MFSAFSIDLSLFNPYSDKTPPSLPAANVFATEQPSSPPKAAPGTVSAATEDTTMIVAAESNKEKAVASANVMASTSSSWTDHVSVTTLIPFLCLFI